MYAQDGYVFVQRKARVDLLGIIHAWHLTRKHLFTIRNETNYSRQLKELWET